MTLPDFLDREQQIDVPSEGVFQPVGLIASWSAAVLYKFFCEDEYPESELNYIRREKRGDWYHYFWHNQALAREHAENTGQTYGADSVQAVWAFQTTKPNVLNWYDDKMRDSFADDITFDNCQIKTFRSKKHRHEFHFIALPAAVAAYATANGWDNPGFDLSELSKKDYRDDPLAITDEIAASLIGDEDGYADALLWQQRVALWEALGEANPRVYDPKKTSSKKLAEALGVYTSVWKEPVYARVVTVLNPRVDALNSAQDKRLGVSALTEFFASKESAQEAADRLKGDDTAEAGATPSGPVVPSDWEDDREGWLAQMAEIRELGKKPVVMKSLRADVEACGTKYAATPDEIAEWWGVTE